jgi:hypothetical protein
MTLRSAARPAWEVIWSSVTPVAISVPPTTLAATVIAPSAAHWNKPAGWTSNRRSCFRSVTSIWCSPSPTRSGCRRPFPLSPLPARNAGHDPDPANCRRQFTGSENGFIMTHCRTQLSRKPRLKQGCHGSRGHGLPSPAHTALPSTSAARIIPTDLFRPPTSGLIASPPLRCLPSQTPRCDSIQTLSHLQSP